MNRPFARLSSLLAVAVIALPGCENDVTRPQDQALLEHPGSVQQALSPEDLTETKLLAGDAAGGDLFGHSVAVSGDVVVVGALFDDDNGSESGSAYVFERADGGWPETAKLLAGDGEADDEFGTSVAVSGDVALIGARGDANGTDPGFAYVFERVGGEWTQIAKLLAGDRALGDQFGQSVALSGDVAVIGAWGDDDNGGSSGSAYVFEGGGGVWTETAKLTASDGAVADLFGFSVAVNGDVAVVGALRDDDNGSNSGSAYVFERAGGGWTQTAKLLASDGAANDNFGESVAVGGDVVVVGAGQAGDNGSLSGSAYVFERAGGGWTQTAKLVASDAAAGALFGESVAVSDDVVLVGARLGGAILSGSAYVFERGGSGWTESAQIFASDAEARDQFGVSVALSGDVAVVGAQLNSDDGLSSGSAYVFESPTAPSVSPVEIDIKPGDDANSLNLAGSRHGRGNAGGRIPVAVLTTSTADGDDFDFDAATADPATITLGDDDGNDTPVAVRRNGALRASLEDVDGDGDEDLVLHFDQQALVDSGDLDEKTTELVLNGETFDGTAFTGGDAVEIVGSR